MCYPTTDRVVDVFRQRGLGCLAVYSLGLQFHELMNGESILHCPSSIIIFWENKPIGGSGDGWDHRFLFDTYHEIFEMQDNKNTNNEPSMPTSLK